MTDNLYTPESSPRDPNGADEWEPDEEDLSLDDEALDQPATGPFGEDEGDNLVMPTDAETPDVEPLAEESLPEEMAADALRLDADADLTLDAYPQTVPGDLRVRRFPRGAFRQWFGRFLAGVYRDFCNPVFYFGALILAWVSVLISMELSLLFTLVGVMQIPGMVQQRQWKRTLALVLLAPALWAMVYYPIRAHIDYADGTGALTWTANGSPPLAIDPSTRLPHTHVLVPGIIRKTFYDSVLRRLVAEHGPMPGSYTGPLPTEDEVIAAWSRSLPWAEWARLSDNFDREQRLALREQLREVATAVGASIGDDPRARPRETLLTVGNELVILYVTPFDGCDVYYELRLPLRNVTIQQAFFPQPSNNAPSQTQPARRDEGPVVPRRHPSSMR